MMFLLNKGYRVIAEIRLENDISHSHNARPFARGVT